MTDPQVPSALQRSTAADQVAGFVYQLERALDALFDLEEGELLGVEVLDDYHVADPEGPRALAQIKLHQSPASLSDGAKDLWKTLGIWARAVTDGSLSLETVREVRLVTTATAPEGSVAAMIVSSAPADDIAERLLAVPRSASPTLGEDFDAVHALSRPTLVRLVERLRLEVSAMSLGEVPDAVERRLRRAGFHESTISDARAALTGWFYGRVVHWLALRLGPRITEAEFHAALAAVRDRFPSGALPVRHADAALVEAEYAGQRSATFVRQLALVGASAEATRSAVRDYLRALRERTGWVARGEILPDELASYDRELVERWEPLHERCRADADGQDEGACRHVGLGHYLDVQGLTIQFGVRWPPFAYLSKGSYQLLADLRRLGWHPRWATLLDPPPSGVATVHDTDASAQPVRPPTRPAGAGSRGGGGARKRGTSAEPRVPTARSGGRRASEDHDD